MYKIFFSILISILLITTLCLSFAKPAMHKQIVVLNSEYTIFDSVFDSDNNKNVTKRISVEPKLISKSIPQTKTNVEMAVNEPIKQKINLEEKNGQTQKVTFVNNKIDTKSSNTISQNKIQAKQEINVEKPKTLNTNQNKTEIETKDEVILWNQWRSNLQNQIMKDSKLPILPEGTVFKFSFDVDKYGKVSNVHTYSTNPSCTVYAIQIIAPVIRSYQGKSILDFPYGSKRYSTTVEGAWRISKTSKYTTAEDFKDSERVIK